MTTESRDRFLADFTRVAPALPGARVPWLTRMRHAGLEQFAQTGFPTTRDEAWKYTSLAALEKRSFTAFPQGDDDVARAQLDSLIFPDFSGHRLVFINGRYSPTLSAIRRLPGGVTLTNLADMLEHAPDALEPLLGEDSRQTMFGELNSAFMADGAYLHLPRGVVVEEPIHLLFVTTASPFEGAAIYPRNIIVAEEGAAATVIEHYAGVDDTLYFTNAVTQIFARGNATIDHYKLQEDTQQAFHIAEIHATQARDSRFTSHSIALGALLSRNDIATTFDAEGCEATLNGLYLVGGRQHVDHHTRIDHAKPNGTSREYYRGLLDGASRGVFNGKVIVHPQAQRTDAHQINHNLLLSKDAEVDTKPQLEIYADDVKCSHGATVGQLDDAEIFYLRSRGLDEAVAKSLLIYAFAHDVIERVRVPALKARLEQVLLARLPEGDRIRGLI